MPASWEKALDAAGTALEEGRRPRRPRWPAGETSNEEAFLLAAAVPRRASAPATSPRAPAASCRSTSSARSPTRRCRRRVPDLEFAHTVVLLESDPIDDAPILDLRIRKGVRRHGVQRRGRQRAPDRARRARRRRPAHRAGGGAALLVALDAALTDDVGDLGGAASAAGATRHRERLTR